MPPKAMRGRDYYVFSMSHCLSVCALMPLLTQTRRRAGESITHM